MQADKLNVVVRGEADDCCFVAGGGGEGRGGGGDEDEGRFVEAALGLRD